LPNTTRPYCHINKTTKTIKANVYVRIPFTRCYIKYTVYGAT